MKTDSWRKLRSETSFQKISIIIISRTLNHDFLGRLNEFYLMYSIREHSNGMQAGILYKVEPDIYIEINSMNHFHQDLEREGRLFAHEFLSVRLVHVVVSTSRMGRSHHSLGPLVSSG